MSEPKNETPKPEAEPNAEPLADEHAQPLPEGKWMESKWGEAVWGP